jgi:DNA-binding XRE family transcriptional regulator
LARSQFLNISAFKFATTLFYQCFTAQHGFTDSGWRNFKPSCQFRYAYVQFFVLVPYEQYIKIMHRLEGDDEATIPHRVVELSVLGNKSPVRAWREYKGLLQKQVADGLDISQAAYSQMEKPKVNLRPETIEKIAGILGIDPEQLNL